MIRGDMAKRRVSRNKILPMTAGNDPSLWRYGSLAEAIAANTDLIARLIREGDELMQASKHDPEPIVYVPELEGA